MPSWAVATLVVVADAVVAWFTVRDTWRFPRTEPVGPWAADTIAASAALAVLGSYSFTAAAYPGYLALSCATILGARLLSPHTKGEGMSPENDHLPLRATTHFMQGVRDVIARRIEAAKTEWMEEQQEVRRREREAMEAGYAGRELAKAPLGTMNLGASADELRSAVLELIRADDRVGLLYLLNDARPRATSAIDRDEIESELAELLDKLAAIAAVALEYEQDDLFSRVIGLFAQIYSLPLGPHDDRALSYSTQINSQEKAPRVFLEVLERLYRLGGLAVRLGRWEAVRKLTLQTPERIDDYWKNWLRHGLTMASRAQRFTQQRDDGQTVEVSLLTLAAQVVERVPSLHPDTDDQDGILTSLAQFDLLANLAAIDGAGSTDSGVFYTNWARFRQERIQPMADRVITDPAVRQAVFRDHGDDDLAAALRDIGKTAHREGIRYDGFWGWDRTPVGDFLQAHPAALS